MLPQTDVIVPLLGAGPESLLCLAAVLRTGGDHLGRLLVVQQGLVVQQIDQDLGHLQAQDPRVELLRSQGPPGLLSCWNQGLDRCRGDAVLLQADVLVRPGWLRELQQAAHTAERTGCATPVVLPPGETVQGTLSDLPPVTVQPLPDLGCCYLRGLLLDRLGLLDETLGEVADALGDWVLRAQALGFLLHRANHALVCAPAPRPLWPSAALQKRHPHCGLQAETFRDGLEARLPDLALRVEAGGKLRVALDLRHVEPLQIGTSVYAHRLAEALAQHPDLALTLVLRNQRQAAGLPARLLYTEGRIDDVDVVHRPGQLWDPADLELLFSSPAHAVITYQDLIAIRAPAVLPSPALSQRYRALSYLSVQAAQCVVAISGTTRREIAAEFGIPVEELPVVHHGVDARHFSRPLPRPDLRSLLPRTVPMPPAPSMLSLNDRYFLAVGTDYPHKGLRLLLSAYHLLRRECPADRPPPSLVLVGNAVDLPGLVYRELSERPQDGVLYLGEVPAEALCALYQHAEALVYASVYEGFGMPPLEAMAAGAPVIAFSISAMPEVCGQAALYPPDMTARSLAAAMRSLITDPGLRERMITAGQEHVAAFTWERTADLTVRAYRRALEHPSPRSLQARRYLRDVFPAWRRGVLEDAALQPAWEAAEKLASWLIVLSKRHPGLVRGVLHRAQPLLAGGRRVAEYLRRE